MAGLDPDADTMAGADERIKNTVGRRRSMVSGVRPLALTVRVPAV